MDGAGGPIALPPLVALLIGIAGMVLLAWLAEALRRQLHGTRAEDQRRATVTDLEEARRRLRREG